MNVPTMVTEERPAPEFDADGYPTDETLDLIEKWEFHDFAGLLEFCRSAWEYPDYWTVKGRTHRVSTGGWSGNESIIAALDRNKMFWALCWQQSRRGGHYIFRVPVIRKSTKGTP